MFFLHRPTPKQAQAFLERQRQAAYSYAEVGQTRTALHPTGYAIDQHSTRLGTGDECFTLARAALKTWKVFETPWIRLTNPAAPFTEGETLVVQIAHLGFFSLVADRVVYIIDEPDCCGFAYGTLTGHAEQGEERFLVSRSASGEGRRLES